MVEYIFVINRDIIEILLTLLENSVCSEQDELQDNMRVFRTFMLFFKSLSLVESLL